MNRHLSHLYFVTWLFIVCVILIR